MSEDVCYSFYDICYVGGGSKPWLVGFETNDDNDDGDPDNDGPALARYRFRTLRDAIIFAGYERTGFAGHRVKVRYGGRAVTQKMVEGAKRQSEVLA